VLLASSFLNAFTWLSLGLDGAASVDLNDLMSRLQIYAIALQNQ
jgi:hypothetical protein